MDVERVQTRFFSRHRSSLSFKRIIFLGLSILAGIILFSFYSVYYQTRALRESAGREIVDLSELVSRNTRQLQCNQLIRSTKRILQEIWARNCGVEWKAFANKVSRK